VHFQRFFLKCSGFALGSFRKNANTELEQKKRETDEESVFLEKFTVVQKKNPNTSPL